MEHRDYYGDAARYDAEYAGFTADRDWYAKRAAQIGGPALELGCGTGRILFALAAAGLQVDGLDRSEAMLAQARTRAATLPPDAARRVGLFQGDIGDFTPPGPYRLVLAPFNFLLHLHTDAELRRGLERVHDLLRPGGMFLFDVTNPLPELLAPTGEASPSPLRRIRVGGDWYLQKERHRYDPQSRISETTFEFEPLFGDQAPFSCALSLRMMNPAEIDMLLAEAGFSGIRRLGSFTGVPFDGRGVVQVVETLRAAPEHSARQGGLGTCTGCSNLQGKPR